MLEGDRLALDERLAGKSPSSLCPGAARQEALEVDEPILERVDQLVGERVAAQLGCEPVGEHHPLPTGS